MPTTPSRDGLNYNQLLKKLVDTNSHDKEEKHQLH
jgi:hypothetical protein